MDLTRASWVWRQQVTVAEVVLLLAATVVLAALGLVLMPFRPRVGTPQSRKRGHRPLGLIGVLTFRVPGAA